MTGSSHTDEALRKAFAEASCFSPNRYPERVNYKKAPSGSGPTNTADTSSSILNNPLWSNTIDADEKVEEKTTEECLFPLHKVFVDLALENDLKGEELEWFKSRITPQKVQDAKVKKLSTERRQIEILTEYKLEKPPDKPNTLLLRLTETDTIWFFSLDTYYSQENPEDAERIRRDNEYYEKKKTKKEITRKRWMADGQTPCFMIKTRETLTTEIVMKDGAVFASEWDLYDTYNALDKCELAPSKQFWKFVDSTKRKTLTSAVVSTEEEAAQTFESAAFKYASLVTERLLASNCFQSQQSIFKTDFRTRYDTKPSQFSYNIDLLWSFQPELQQPLTVTAMEWNPLNQDLLTVGYGDLSFEKGSSGLVCVWSCKNPRQPERRFQFEDSVTSLHHSRCRPNILAVGTRKGHVYVLDVSGQEKEIRVLGSEGSKPHPGPVWKIEWFLHKELTVETEELLAVGESGMLMIFSTSIDKDTRDILKLGYVTTTPKILEKKPPKKICRRMFFQEEILDKKTFSGLSFSIYSRGHFCYIATKEGVVVKCNLMNPSMTDGVFLAHDGPVYTIQHSPVTDVVFLTCGADWKIKIWMEGIDQPLITLQQKAPVACARWSPTIPTLIAAVGETELSLWDIARNILTPMSTRKIENSGKLCTFLFSSNGANVMVGSDDGLVHVVHLSELPRIPFLQKERLTSVIRKILLREKNNLFDKFCRAVDANRDKLKTNIIENLQLPGTTPKKEQQPPPSQTSTTPVDHPEETTNEQESPKVDDDDDDDHQTTEISQQNSPIEGM